MGGCILSKNVTPADQVKGERFAYDCCNPGITPGTKAMCKLAEDSPNHTLIDPDGNRYEFIWSDCRIGNEVWLVG